MQQGPAASHGTGEIQMATPRGYRTVKDSAHPHPKSRKKLGPVEGNEQVTVTLLLRRQPGAPKIKGVADFADGSRPAGKRLPRARFAKTNGADPKDLRAVAQFAREHGLT